MGTPAHRSVTPDEALRRREGTSMRGDRRLVWLVTAHLVLGLVSGVLTPIEVRMTSGLPHLPIVPLFALTFCQVILLGFWAVFSPTAWWKRLGGLVGAVAYQEALFDLS